MESVDFMDSPLAQILYAVFIFCWLYYCGKVLMNISNTLDRIENV